MWFGLAKYFQDYLRKGIFLHFVAIFRFLCWKTGKTALLRGDFFAWNRSYRVSKIENFMLISKMQTFLSDKMPIKKVKIKKPFSYFAKSHFLFLYFSSFWGHLSLRQVCILKISLKFSILWYPIWPTSRKNISPLRRVIFQNFWHKSRKR